MNIFTHDDWLTIKKMQGRKWRLKTIRAHTKWSERTVNRVLRSRTWREYHTMIHKETETIRRRRVAENWQKTGPFIEEKINRKVVVPVMTRKERILIIVIVLVVTLLTFNN